MESKGGLRRPPMPDGLKASLSPLANHLFFGLCMAAGIALL